jgi:putative oligomerization/nucleic acid binding protein
MFMRRRRPLMRAAMIGGTAYVAGRAGQNAAMRQQDAESQSQQQQQSPPQQQQQSSSLADQLNQLAQLHQSGALSDGDFEAAKQKLLAS